jgi:hypothetical protein
MGPAGIALPSLNQGQIEELLTVVGIAVPVILGVVPATRKWFKAVIRPVRAKLGDHSPTEPRVGEEVSIVLSLENQTGEPRYVRVAVEPEAAYHGFFDGHRLEDPDTAKLVPEPVRLEPEGPRSVVVRFKLKGPFDPARNRACVHITVYSQAQGGRERRAGAKKCKLVIAENRPMQQQAQATQPAPASPPSP